MKKINCVLLIDDNSADNEFHKIIIRKTNVFNHIRVATNGEEALSYLIKAGEQGQSESFPKPDLIYLDINMPRMNGFEFLAAYKKLDEQLKSKEIIIMLTTSLNPDDQKRALNYEEVKEFQIKPLTDKTVQETIERYFF
jgi:CheY-like chemotaxis protein